MAHLALADAELERIPTIARIELGAIEQITRVVHGHGLEINRALTRTLLDELVEEFRRCLGHLEVVEEARLECALVDCPGASICCERRLWPRDGERCSCREEGCPTSGCAAQGRMRRAAG